MTRNTLEWLRWLVGQQSVQLGSEDARAAAAAAWQALDEIDAELAK